MTLQLNLKGQNCVRIVIGSAAHSRSLSSESHSAPFDSLGPHGLYSPWNSPGQNTVVDSRSLLQGIFLTQGLNPGLPHCRWILYQLNHKGSPKHLKLLPQPHLGPLLSFPKPLFFKFEFLIIIYDPTLL